METLNGGHKDILKHNKTFLMHNIIPCEDLYYKLQEHNIFTTTMLSEIKEAGPSQENKNSKLLELLSLRSNQTALRFCDVLQLSGHNFLAQTLREDMADGSLSQIVVDPKDVFKKIPKLQKHLDDGEKEALRSYLKEKIKEEAIRLSWKRDGQSDKQKTLEAKQQLIEDSMKSTKTLKEKDEAIHRMKTLLDFSNEESRDRSLEVRHLNEYIEELKQKHKKEMETQIQFNVANDRSLRRLTEREVETNKGLQDLSNSIQQMLEKYGSSERVNTGRMFSGMSRRTSSADSIKLSPLDLLRTLLDKLSRVVAELSLFREKYQALTDEKQLILTLLALPANTGDNISLPDRLKEIMSEKDRVMEKLTADVAAAERALKNAEDNQNTGAQLQSLQNAIETQKCDLLLKDGVIQRLEEDVSKLKKQLSQGTHVAKKRTTKLVVVRKGTPYKRKTSSSPVASSPSPSVSSSPDSDDDEEVVPRKVGFTKGVQFRIKGTKAAAKKVANFKQEVFFPPLPRGVDFRLTGNRHDSQYRHSDSFVQSDSQQHNNQTSTKPGLQRQVSKSTHSMSTGATQISGATQVSPGNTGVSFDVGAPNLVPVKPKKHGKVFQIASINTGRKQGAKAAVQFNGQPIKFLGAQPAGGMRRNPSFYR